MASSSGPDMKQKALPSWRFTCAACPKTSSSWASFSSASNWAMNCSSVSSPVGKLPLVLSWVSMKYFIGDLLSQNPWLLPSLDNVRVNASALGVPTARRQGRKYDRHHQKRRHVPDQVPTLRPVGQRLDGHDGGVHDARPDREPDQARVRRRILAGEEEKDSERGIDSEDHHKVMRVPVAPCPAGGPHDPQGVDAEDEDEADDGEREAKIPDVIRVLRADRLHSLVHPYALHDRRCVHGALLSFLFSLTLPRDPHGRGKCLPWSPVGTRSLLIGPIGK